MHPEFFALERGLHDPATVDVAVIEKFFLPLAAQLQPVRAAAKTFAESANEFSLVVIYHYRLTAHARLVDGVGDVDTPLRILAEAMRIPPQQPSRRHQPVVDALIGMGA